MPVFISYILAKQWIKPLDNSPSAALTQSIYIEVNTTTITNHNIINIFFTIPGSGREMIYLPYGRNIAHDVVIQ